MHMPDVLQAEPPRVADAHRAGGPNATREPAQDGNPGTETARNGSSFLAIIEEMLAGSMDGMDEIRQLSSLKTAEREAGGAHAPGESDALKKRGAGVANDARSGKNYARADALTVSGRKGFDADGVRPGELTDGKNAATVNEGRLRTRTESADGAESQTLEGLENSLRRLAARGTRGEGEPSDGNDGTFGARIDSASLATAFSAREAPVAAFLPAGRKEGAVEVEGDDRATGAVGRAAARDRKAAIAVRDERTLAAVQERIAREGLAEKASGGPLETETTETADGVADMSIGFRAERPAGGYGETQAALRADGGQSGEASFSTMLSQELREQAGEFVKAGKIVLRDGNSGTIRLTLHPESLGNVRISLDLSGDKRISGRIHVASKEAYDAFLENLDGLSDAFVEGGFESAGFDLSWSGNPGYRGDDGTDNGSVSAPFYASSVPDVMSRTNSTDRFGSGYRGYGMSAIDVFA